MQFGFPLCPPLISSSPFLRCGSQGPSLVNILQLNSISESVLQRTLITPSDCKTGRRGEGVGGGETTRRFLQACSERKKAAGPGTDASSTAAASESGIGPSRKAGPCSPTSRRKAVGVASARPQPGEARLEKLRERLEAGRETDLQAGVGSRDSVGERW